MDSNNISISSDKEKDKININISSINPNKINNSQGPITNNTTENININDYNNNNNSSLNILNFINEMPFENLNDFYDIESSLFLKRVEKLNLKFFWTSECILNQQDIKYPYNKLFLILFKQISLYIEEIAKLNKQLKQKNKNEKYYQIKIVQMKQKEKEYALNKQMLKNLQRDNKLLEKKNEKNINEIEKLNKKLSSISKSINLNSLSNTTTHVMHLKKNNNFFLGSPKNNNITMRYDSIITHKSPLNKKDNKLSDFSYLSNENNLNNNHKIKNFSNSIDASSNKKYKNNNEDIVNKGIIQCDEEIENLELIEDILKEFKKKNINNNYRNNSSNNVVNKNNININKKIKEKYYNKSGIPIKKNLHLSYKNDDLSKK